MGVGVGVGICEGTCGVGADVGVVCVGVVVVVGCWWLGLLQPVVLDCCIVIVVVAVVVAVVVVVNVGVGGGVGVSVGADAKHAKHAPHHCAVQPQLSDRLCQNVYSCSANKKLRAALKHIKTLRFVLL